MMMFEPCFPSARNRAMFRQNAFMSRHFVLTTMLAVLNLPATFAGADTYTITLDAAARADPATGRVILFFVTQSGAQWARTEPRDAPFFSVPQPIASIEVRDLKPGDSVTIDGQTAAFPASLDALDGKVHVQAVLDADQTERSFNDGPGNVYSDVVLADVAAQREDTVSLTLS